VSRWLVLQDEPPFYHAKEIAVDYAGLVKGLCLLGSATRMWRYIPSRAEPLAIPDPAGAHPGSPGGGSIPVERLGLASHYRPLEAQAEYIELPLVKVIDMRNELKAATVRSSAGRCRRTLRCTRKRPAGNPFPEPAGWLPMCSAGIAGTVEMPQCDIP